MKLLEIKDNRAFYNINGTLKSIKEVNKEDIFILLNKIYDDEQEIVEFDENESEILNEAEKIIYYNLKKYLKEFNTKKDEIKNSLNQDLDEINSFFDEFQNITDNNI